MDNVVSIDKFVEVKHAALAKHEARMQALLAEARRTIDEAIEKRDFNLLYKAYHITDQAVKENDQIKRIRKSLHIYKEKVNVQINQKTG